MFLRWPVRTISFNHTGDLIASASEDLFIDIVSLYAPVVKQKILICMIAQT